MPHMSYPQRRIARSLGWSLIGLVLSASATGAAPNESVTRVAQAQTEPAVHRPPAQDVSEALGERLNRMMLDTKPVAPR